jgi:PAS domain S-box-containing protein
MALIESEAQLRTLINRAPVGIVLLDNDAVIQECNSAFHTMLGYNRAELIGAGFNQAMHSNDVFQSKKQYAELIEGKIEVYRMEQRYIRKDLREVWGSLSASTVRTGDGEIRFIILMIEDATERRKAEKKIISYQKKLRLLTSRLSLDEERKRHLCATNLHDHIGQVLLFIRLKIGKLLQDRDEKDPDLQEIINLIDQVIKCTRSLIYELSPPILYELGLEDSIEWLSDNLAKQHGIKVKLNRDNNAKSLNTEMSILLFQAVREVFDNIVKHAKARVATTSIKRDGNDLLVIVEDDGVGFDPQITDLKSHKDHGLGLFGIGERLEHVGGRFAVESNLGKGTIVTISLPMEHNNKKNWTDLLKKNVQTCTR